MFAPEANPHGRGFTYTSLRGNSMEEGLPPAVPFLPHRLIKMNSHHLVIGTEGELLLLGEGLAPLQPSATPFPMRISHAAVHDDVLLATWIDGELMKARMAAIDLHAPVENGVARAVLRTHNNPVQPLHPAGASWSHVLDAEPLALAANDGVVVFALWRRGLYAISQDATEQWRQPEAEWSYTKARPRATEIVAIHLEPSTFTLTSRGGRIQRRLLDTGELVEEFIPDGPEAPIEHHFREGEHHLMVSTTGAMHWLYGDRLIAKVQSGGAVQSATWDEQWQGWRVAGWREEILISTERTERHAWDEIPVALLPVTNGALVLFNDGSWANSPFERRLGATEES